MHQDELLERHLPSRTTVREWSNGFAGDLPRGSSSILRSSSKVVRIDSAGMTDAMTVGNVTETGESVTPLALGANRAHRG